MMITLVEQQYVLTLGGYRVGSFATYDEAYQVWTELTQPLAA